MIIRTIYEKGFFHLLTANFLQQFLGFGILVIAARFLDPVELGEIRIIQSYSVVFAVLASFGAGTALLKIASENRSLEERETLLGAALRRVAVTTAASLVLLVILASTGIITSSEHLALWLIIYALHIPFAAGTEIFLAYLQALKKIREIARTQMIIKLQAFVFIIFSTVIWGFRGFIFATIAAYIAGQIPLLITTGTGFLKRKTGPLPAGFISLAFFGAMTNVTSLIGKFGDIFILDHFAAQREEIGFYALASLFMFGAIQVTSTIQTISTPYFSERATDISWLRQTVRSTQLKMAGLSIVAAVGLYVVAYLLVEFYYGPAYRSMMQYIPILLLRYIVWSCFAVVGVALLGMGYMKYNLIVVSITTPVLLVLSYVFLQSMGIPGVAWAQVTASGIGFVLTMILYRTALRKIKEKITINSG
jgi:O-antigen/teichoic acid export membrane protein